jgi:hypothetical protein
MKGTFGRFVLGAAVAAAQFAGAFALLGAGTGSAAAQSMSEAGVRVVHASPDAPAVDVYVNGQKAISNLAFKEASPWAMLPAGTYDVKVTAAGGTDAVIQANLPLEGGKYYSVVAVGRLSNITAKVVEDNLMLEDSSKTKLQVVHASPDAPAVDVAVTGGPTLVPGLAFPNASGYLTVDPMTVDVEVRAAGTNTVAIAVPDLTLEAGKVYNVYAVGLLNGSPALSVLPIVDNAMAAGAGMPTTGAGEFSIAVLALILIATATLTGGLVLRRAQATNR